MEEIGKGIKTIFDRIGHFFDIFDLSFFVSGIATGSAFLYLYFLNADEFDFDIPSSFLKVLLVIIFFYITGLVSFALGRFIRLEIFRSNSYNKMDQRIRMAIKVHQLEDKEPYKNYLSLPESHRGSWRLYVRLWAKLRDEPGLINSFSQVNRYWVMAATYDGIVVSLLTWALTMGYLTFLNKQWVQLDVYFGSFLVLLLVGAAFACKWEAQRNLLNQVDEIIAISANSSSFL